MRGLATPLIVVACVIMATSACGSSAARSGPTLLPSTISADESNAGSTVTTGVGSRIVVTLHSTYWHFTTPHPAGVLRAAAADVQPSSSPRFPGSGAGTVTVSFLALHRGTATVVATRLSCGEALRCTPGEADYHLVVVVR